MDVGAVGVSLHVLKRGAACARLHPTLQQAIDQLEERPTGHAHPLALIGLLRVVTDGSDGSLAVRVDVQVEGEREHRQHAGDGLQLGRVDACCACDVYYFFLIS